MKRQDALDALRIAEDDLATAVAGFRLTHVTPEEYAAAVRVAADLATVVQTLRACAGIAGMVEVAR